MTITAEVLNKLIKDNEYESYLEFGENDETFQQIELKKREFTEHSDLYHSKNKFDMIFIDGVHTAEVSMKDFRIAIELLNKGGMIVFHDTNPPDSSFATKHYSKGGWCGEVWKTIIQIRQHKKYDVVTYDVDMGYSVVTVEENKDLLEKFEVGIMIYDDMGNNKKRYLNLLAYKNPKKK